MYVILHRNGLLRPIKVVVTPIPFPNADITVPRMIPRVFPMNAPEKRKMTITPIVKETYALTVSQ